MKGAIAALLVHDGEACFGRLESILEKQGIETRRARTCMEALALLAQTGAPQLVFTDTQLPDGTWADILSLAAQVDNSVKVIVASRLVDLKLYLEALERGAFDFIVPPFGDEDVAYIVRSATWSGLERGSRPPAPVGRPPQTQLPDKGATGPRSRVA